MNRALVCLLLTVLLVTDSVVEAQQTAKVRRIGLLGRWPAHWIDVFRQELREIGWVEGRNITIEYRNPEGRTDLRSKFAAELVHLKVDVIVAVSTSAALAARQATKTIPIVMTSSDPVGTGLVTSLAQPGGNVTGTTSLSADLGGKRLELLKEVVPNLSRVAALWRPAAKGNQPQMKEIEVAARPLQIQLLRVGIEGANDLENAFSRMTRERADALITMSGPWGATHAGRIVELAASHRLPAIYTERSFAEVGGLMSYGTDRNDQLRKVAVYVDKILKGAKPADLPAEQPTAFELVINLKTAKQIAVTIPPAVLMEADKVIK
jgi:putative ABC transport system substrate-binding protein